MSSRICFNPRQLIGGQFVWVFFSHGANASTATTRLNISQSLDEVIDFATASVRCAMPVWVVGRVFLRVVKGPTGKKTNKPFVISHAVLVNFFDYGKTQ